MLVHAARQFEPGQRSCGKPVFSRSCGPSRRYRRPVPAPFAKDLCRYRGHGMPNTSDRSDKASVALGNALFEVLGVDPDHRGDEPTGSPFALSVADHLAAQVNASPGRVIVEPERPLNVFQQYRHVGALADIEIEQSPEYAKAWRRLVAEVRKQVTSPPRTVERVEGLVKGVDDAVAGDVLRRRRALSEVGAESLLKLDVTIADPQPGRLPELEVGLSLKWSLRTDRAQDCRSQGAKLSALRRGRMPHFAAVTMEPRPYMLNLLGGGSGDIDCVYHLDLRALTQAIDDVYGAKVDKNAQRTVATFRRLVEQRRLRDYDELVQHAVLL